MLDWGLDGPTAWHVYSVSVPSCGVLTSPRHLTHLPTPQLLLGSQRLWPGGRSAEPEQRRRASPLGSHRRRLAVHRGAATASYLGLAWVAVAQCLSAVMVL